MDRMQVLLALRAAVASADADRFALIAGSTHPADIAAALSELDADRVYTLLGGLPVRARTDVFGYLDPDRQHELAERLGRSELAELFLHMSSDERADLFKQLDEAQRESFLPALAQVEREDIRTLAQYAEGTAGAIMTSEYATVGPHLSATEAIEHLRNVAPDTETIYQAYVTDDDRKLVGTVSLKDLVISPPRAPVADLMDRNPVSVRADAPQEEAARLISNYDLIALPVVDTADRLVGIITYDDAMDVAEAEATEDFRKVGGVEEFPLRLKNAPVALLYRKRVFWLVVLVFGNLLSGAAIAYFEDTIAAHLALIFFLPLLIASSGNAGAQSATLMVRALATGDVVLKDWTRMLLRELAVAAMLGVTMSAAVWGVAIWRGGPGIGLLVALTMVLVVIAGSLIGMSLPFVLHRFGLDPAASSAPLITSIADGIGVVVYLALATAILGV
jgi:magnesium transporter